jgi:hypothetical protein
MIVEQMVMPTNMFFGLVIDLIELIDFAPQLCRERSGALKRQLNRNDFSTPIARMVFKSVSRRVISAMA